MYIEEYLKCIYGINQLILPQIYINCNETCYFPGIINGLREM